MRGGSIWQNDRSEECCRSWNEIVPGAHSVPAEANHGSSLCSLTCKSPSSSLSLGILVPLPAMVTQQSFLSSPYLAPSSRLLMSLFSMTLSLPEVHCCWAHSSFTITQAVPIQISLLPLGTHGRKTYPWMTLPSSPAFLLG